MSTLRVNGIRHSAGTSDAITIASDNSCTANITNNLSNRNLIINGAMQVAQRGTSGFTSDGYTLDRFKLEKITSGALSVSQSTETPDGFANSLHADCTTAMASPAAGNLTKILTKIEGQDLQNVAKGTSAAKKMILSFYVKTNLTGTYTVSFYDNDNSRTFTGTYVVSNANWNRYTISVPADTTGAFGNDNGSSLEIYWQLASGTTYTSGSAGSWATYANANWAAGQTANFFSSTDNNWYLTGVKLEVDQTGSGVATDFEHRSYAQELALCQRYFHTQHVFTANDPYFLGYYGGGAGYMRYFLPVTMRTYPNITFNTHSQVQAYDNNWADRSISASTSDKNRVILWVNTSAHNYGKLLRLSGGTTYPIFYAECEL